MKFNRSVYQSLTMISQFGINMLVLVFICSFFGMFLDKQLGTSFLVIILFFIGALAGFRNVYVFARKIFSKDSGEEAYMHGRHQKPKASENMQETADKSEDGKNDNKDKQNII